MLELRKRVLEVYRQEGDLLEDYLRVTCAGVLGRERLSALRLPLVTRKLTSMATASRIGAASARHRRHRSGVE